ncbi:MAG: hypothetical protein SP1CHLAM54_14940 [Chlamydiia bacterium]|nr:hypothetical protein [Chlamydiia bacterium]MCH9616384.1 hypothetical protein [Chlamydiia bacterium]MCH9629630.1 hypothetical protein [Chlamydiia bacterium]
MKTLYKLTLLCLLTACVSKAHDRDTLTSIQIIDRNGFDETVSTNERLALYDTVDFLEPQPYKKIVRIYSSKGSKMTSYHSNGYLSQYLELLQGRAHGFYREFYPNGGKKIEAFVIEGVGDLTPEAQATYLFEGVSRAWDEEGNLSAEIPYKKGHFEGEAVYYYKTGEIKKTVNFRAGMVSGKLTEYQENGQKLVEEIYDADRLLTGTYPNHSVENGNGIRAVYESGDLKATYTYVQGVPEGEVTLFSNGEKNAIYHIAAGEKHGQEMRFFETGKPKISFTWYKDKIQGAAKSWYASGQLESEKEMYQNKKHGNSFCWYKDGSLMMVEEYELGVLVSGKYMKRGQKTPVSTIKKGEGVATLYDEDGILIRKVKYERGQPIEE